MHPMSRIPSIAISAGLIGLGALAWSFAGRPLLADHNFDYPVNPLGIQRSPYGEVFAMAMQGPIDTTFHGAMAGGGARGHHDHANCGDSCPAHRGEIGKQAPTRFTNLLTSLDRAVEQRTNPRAAGESHKRYLRRKVEDKLRFAYQLDPSHYANYNSLHFFLTEPQLGTRPELTPSAAKLAEDTIRYCLERDDDPRPALTAAAAASNILELMFNDRNFNETPRFTLDQMRHHLTLLDFCIQRYVAIAREWDKTGNWDLLSAQRIHECDERFLFISRFREAAQGTIDRLSGAHEDTQAVN